MARGRASLDIPDLSVPDLQSTLLETVRVAHPNQIKYLGSFDVLTDLPRDTAVSASDMAAFLFMDRFAILRESRIFVLYLRLSKDIPEDVEPIRGVALLNAVFVAISDKCRRFLTKH